MAMASSSRLPEIIFSPAPASEPVTLHHEELNTTFTGVSHALSTVSQPIVQFRGIQYATIPGRFQHSSLCTSYPEHTDATSHGPVCPQITPIVAAPGLDGEAPEDPLAQSELDCLNLIITCPSPSASSLSAKHPVMVWIHGGEHTGAGSHWLYDAGAIVDKSLASHQPVIVVSINFRLGIFGNAAGPVLRSASGEAVGNYGLADQRTALRWIRRYIAGFGGDKDNVTLFGEGTGAADILHHVHASGDEERLFTRAIAQSPLGAPEADVTTLYNAGYQLNKLAGSVGGIQGLRNAPAEELVKLSSRYSIRGVDDPSFFPAGWRARLADTEAPRVPVILGESSFAAQPWAPKAAEWDAQAISKRINAVAQSRKHAGGVMKSYELAPPAVLPEELPERVCDLLHDTRFAWPVESSARRLSSAGTRVYRYLWDQEGRGEDADAAMIPHDVAYLFDTVPAPQDAGDSPFDIAVFDDADDEELAASLTSILTAQSSRSNSSSGSFSLWDAPPPVDRWSFAHVRDTLLSKWLAFAHGCAPWDQDGVFVFGPEGECGVRPRTVLQSRRRVKLWEEALAGMEMGLVQKLGVELANGPCW